MPNTEIKLSLVIPVYNSEKIVFKLHKRLINTLSRMTNDFELIFVNDCSTDNSWEKLKELASTDPHVKAVILRKNYGYDNAVMAGLRLAKGSFVVVMDDDLQHEPEDMPNLLKEIKKGFDVVYVNFKKKEYSIFKNLASWLNGKIAQLIINKPKGLYLSAFKILRKEIVSEIIKYDGPFPYIDGLIFQVTSSIHQIMGIHHERLSGKSNFSLRKSLRIVVNFCTTFSILPLRIASYTGFAISVLAGIISIVLVILKLWFGYQSFEGWTSLILAVLILGGLQLMGIGILGEYIGRTYMSINRRPQYAIREIRTINSDSSPSVDQ